jgi:predicted metal-binding membrane protein
MGADSERLSTLIETALRDNRTPVILLLVLLPLVSWAWIVAMANDMYGPMTGASAWMMTTDWDVRHLLLLWAMWAVMMTAMMLPSASPFVLLYGDVYALAAGYLLVWAMFSLGATVLQRMLTRLLLLSPMMEAMTASFGAALLFIAGVYQLTPLKYVCLRTCRSPLGFLMSQWRTGWAAAFGMGVRHGAYCVGCCWALMLLLFAGGVMNLTVIAALTALVAFEKLAPFGDYAAPISGVLLMSVALWMLLR